MHRIVSPPFHLGSGEPHGGMRLKLRDLFDWAHVDAEGVSEGSKNFVHRVQSWRSPVVTRFEASDHGLTNTSAPSYLHL